VGDRARAVWSDDKLAFPVNALATTARTYMPHTRLGPIPTILFYSRWLQLPLYLGLIVAQGVYVWYFMVELAHLVEAAFGSKDALELILKNVTPPGAETVNAPPETLVMLVVLG
jgi:hypothetical protein